MNYSTVRALGLAITLVGWGALADEGPQRAESLLFADRVAATENLPFPRLLGMNMAKDTWHLPQYQDELAKLDVLILGFYTGWNKLRSDEPIRDAVRAIKKKNPKILIGQYTILNETQDDLPRFAMFRDKAIKLSREGWWLRRADGQRVQWTNQYDAWDTNFTEWTKPDFNGQRYSQWLAERDYRFFFKPVPEFDIWYFDNVMAKPRIARADWRLDGKDDTNDSAEVQVAHRKGHLVHWQHSRQLAPAILQMGNTDNDLSATEFKGKLNGAFLEGLMGKPWSIESRGGWDAMMRLYRTTLSNTTAPHLVGFNVHGKVDDYPFFRLAFTSCLLADGFFSFTDAQIGYGSVPWFDEYNIKLGSATQPPPVSPWKNGVWRRNFERGVVLVNPSSQTLQAELEAGFVRFRGTQDPIVNTGKAVNRISIPPRDGLVLIKTQLQN